MRGGQGRAIALGGVFAAVALTLFSLGGLIPVATYAIPVFASAILWLVLGLCGRRIAWAWYALVAFLALLVSPDKEAAMVFLFIGYYPILKPRIDGSRLAILWKLLLFNGSIAAMYTVFFFLTGMDALVADYAELGIAGMVLMGVMGNLTFFLLDYVLGKRLRFKK